MAVTRLQDLTASARRISSSQAALEVFTVNSSGEYVSPGAGSTVVSVRGVFDSSGGALTDSTQNSVAVTIREGSAAGSTLVTIRQSTYTDLNILGRVADRDASTAVAAVLGTDPVSTTYGLTVRQVGFSTTVQVSSLAGAVIIRSSAANALMSAYQSTAADLNAAVVQGSTVWQTQVSTVQGRVLVDQNSTVWQTQAALRLGQTPLSTTVVITSTNSTAVYEVVSSAAAVRHKVFAYSVGSTHTNPSTLIFMSSGVGGNAGHDLWHVPFGSGSSGMTGANLATSLPGFLFGTVAANGLSIRIEGGNSTAASTTVARVSFSYVTEA